MRQLRLLLGISVLCLAPLHRCNATSLPGQPDLGFLPRIVPSAVLPLPDGRIVVAGVDSEPSTAPSLPVKVVIFNADGSLADGPWVMSPRFSQVLELNRLPDGAILAAGFRSLSGIASETSLARLEPGGVVDPMFGASIKFSGEIRQSVILPDGRLIIAGLFKHSDTPQMSGVARLAQDGNFDPTFAFGGGARAKEDNAIVFALKLLPTGGILVGGTFTSFDGKERHGLVRLLQSGEVDDAFQPFLNVGSWVRTIALQPDERMLLAGQIYMPGQFGSTLVRLDATGAEDLGFRKPSIPINAGLTRMGLAVDTNGYILFSGAFNSVNGILFGGIVRLLSNGLPDPNFAPYDRGVAGSPTPSSLTLGHDGSSYHWPFPQLAIAGSAWPLVRLQGGTPAPFRPAILYALSTPEPKVLDEGSRTIFTVYPIGFPEPALQWFSNGTQIPGATNQNLDIPALQRSFNGTLSVAAANSLGSVTQQVATLAVLPKSHSSGAVDTSFHQGDPSLDAIFSMAEETSGDLLLVGHVAQEGGTRVLRFGPNGVRVPSFLVNLDPLPSSPLATAILLPLPDGGILMGGKFGGVAGIQRSNLARLTMDGRVDPAFADLGGSSAPLATLLLLRDGRYCVAGTFAKIQGVAQARLAILKPDGSVDETFRPNLLELDGPILQLFQTSDGGIVAAGKWSQIGDQAHAGLLKIGLDGQVDLNSFKGLTGKSVVAAACQDGGIVASELVSGSNPIESRIVRFLSDGQVDPGFQPPSVLYGEIFNIAVDKKRRIALAGPKYLSTDGVSFRPFLRLLEDGSLDASFARNAVANSSLVNSSRSMQAMRDGRLATIQASQIVMRIGDGQEPSAPQLVASLVDRGVLPGTRTVLGAPVEGEDLEYTWYFNGMPTTEHQSTYVVSATPLEFGEYFVVAHNAFGSVTSSTARVVPIGGGPIVAKTTTNPGTAFPGDEFTFGSLVYGTAPLQLQWYRSGQLIPGQTGRKLRLPAVHSSDSGWYELVVRNSYGEGHGSAFQLTVQPECFLAEALDFPSSRWVANDPQVWRSVTDDTTDGVDAVKAGPLAEGSSPWLQTRVLGPGTLRFHWKLGDPDSKYALSFALSSTLAPPVPLSTRTTVSPVWETVSLEIPSGVRYPTWTLRQLTSSEPSTTYALLDDVSFTPQTPVPPIISRQPESVTLSPGGVLRLSVVVVSQLPVSIEWSRNQTAIPGAVGSTLNLSGVQESDSGDYEVVVSNSQGSVASTKARVTVTEFPTPLTLGLKVPAGLKFEIPEESDRTYKVEATEDLVNWFNAELWTLPTNGSISEVVDALGQTRPYRFYRAVFVR